MKDDVAMAQTAPEKSVLSGGITAFSRKVRAWAFRGVVVAVVAALAVAIVSVVRAVTVHVSTGNGGGSRFLADFLCGSGFQQSDGRSLCECRIYREFLY